MINVRLSAKSARLKFTQCGPACIAGGCTGKCCDAPTRPGGCLVAIHPTEQARIVALGANVVDGFIKPPEGTKGCPFKQDGLCTLHASGDKPFGCIASPFTVNGSGTLIVRNRYKLLPCYRSPGHKDFAYRVFKSSIQLLFGHVGADEIADHLDHGGGDRLWPMPIVAYRMLVDNDLAKRQKSGLFS